MSDTPPALPAPALSTVHVDAFVQRHFTWPGSLRLHRRALGADLLRAPANVLLSPILVLTRLFAFIFRKIGLGTWSSWLMRRKLLLRTSVAARVEALVLTELLDVPLESRAAGYDRAELTRSILAAPRLREVIRQSGSISAGQVIAAKVMDALSEYSGTRSAVAEFATALLMLIVGAIVFQSLTPGAISLAPGFAGKVAYGTAVADFPLGATVGQVWYGVFPVGPSPGLMALTVVGLVLCGAIVATFAGILADPLQVRLGIHQRRLARLMASVETITGEAQEKPFTAPEHFLVRIFDLWDAVLSLFRIFRG